MLHGPKNLPESSGKRALKSSGTGKCPPSKTYQSGLTSDFQREEALCAYLGANASAVWDYRGTPHVA
jgi:hypothetical protein